jgi:hypothetical protein
MIRAVALCFHDFWSAWRIARLPRISSRLVFLGNHNPHWQTHALVIRSGRTRKPEYPIIPENSSMRMPSREALCWIIWSSPPPNFAEIRQMLRCFSIQFAGEFLRDYQTIWHSAFAVKLTLKSHLLEKIFGIDKEIQNLWENIHPFRNCCDTHDLC